MPELSEALHELYEQEARVFTTPSGGLNVIAARARSARRGAMLRSAGIGVGAAFALGAVVLGGTQLWGPRQAPPLSQPSALPSAVETLDVTWDPAAALAQAAGDFQMPECGEAFAPEPASVSGVSVRPGEVRLESNEGVSVGVGDTTVDLGTEGGVSSFMVPTIFASADAGVSDLVYGGPRLVVTQDGTVVYTEPLEATELDLWNAGTDAPPVTLNAQGMCAAQEDRDATVGDADSDTLTPEQQAERDAASVAWFARWSQIPSGEYQVYLVAPIMFGDTLAAAREIKAAGARHLWQVTSDIGSTPFAQDDRVRIFCTETTDPPVTFCQVPDEVLSEVLTFPVDPAQIVNLPSGIAISVPATLVVP